MRRADSRSLKAGWASKRAGLCEWNRICCDVLQCFLIVLRSLWQLGLSSVPLCPPTAPAPLPPPPPPPPPLLPLSNSLLLPDAERSGPVYHALSVGDSRPHWSLYSWQCCKVVNLHYSCTPAPDSNCSGPILLQSSGGGRAGCRVEASGSVKSTNGSTYGASPGKEIGPALLTSWGFLSLGPFEEFVGFRQEVSSRVAGCRISDTKIGSW